MNPRTREPANPDSVVAYIDGGARGNPGPAGFGVRIEQPDATLIEEFHGAIGTATNNVAEYRGLLAALEWARAHGRTRVHVRSDSMLLVQQMLGNYKVKHPGLQPLYARARLLAHEIGRVTFEHIERAKNAHADRLANAAMDAAVASRQSSGLSHESSGLSRESSGPSRESSGLSRESSGLSRESAGVGRATDDSRLKADDSRLKTDDSGLRTDDSGLTTDDRRLTTDPFTPLVRAVRVFIYRHFVDTARAPTLDAMVRATGASENEVIDALQCLADAHALVLAPASTSIWMAHPFSAVPTDYPVDTNGRRYWANCAWDAAGILSMLGADGVTQTRCADCGEPLTMSVHEGRIAGEGVVHYAVPPRRFWENVAYT